MDYRSFHDNFGNLPQPHLCSSCHHCRFFHAPLGPDEHIYVYQPAGFQHDGDFVLKLKKSVYGLLQSSCNFFQYLSNHQAAQGLTPSAFDPCLFIEKSVIMVVYINNLLINAKSYAKITTLIFALQTAGICIRCEGTAEDFLDNNIICSSDSTSSQITLLQTGLTK